MRIWNRKNKTGNPWLKSSYSQCGEDLIIKFIFDNLSITQPSYIDIGAHHPFYLSNTALFYEQGSTGVNIEPDPTLIAPFFEHRKRDVNLNIGIAEKAGTADFFIISTPTLNTFSKDEAERYSHEGDYKIINTISVSTKSLSDIIKEHCAGKFPQFLSVDAEGVDEMIIRSIDYKENYPLVICIETISFSNSGNGVKNTYLIQFIQQQGYLLYADTYINTIFVRKNIWQQVSDGNS